MKPFRLGPRPRLQISDDCKNELQTLLVRVEKASQPAPTPTKNMHQQLQADMNYVTPSLSGKKKVCQYQHPRNGHAAPSTVQKNHIPPAASSMV
jgi:hypothetical protein